MVELHAAPLVWTLRLYDEPGGHEHRRPYIAVATISLLGERAWISGLHGRFDRQAWRLVNDWLKGQGVKVASMERHGRRIERPVT